MLSLDFMGLRLVQSLEVDTVILVSGRISAWTSLPVKHIFLLLKARSRQVLSLCPELFLLMDLWIPEQFSSWTWFNRPFVRVGVRTELLHLVGVLKSPFVFRTPCFLSTLDPMLDLLGQFRVDHWILLTDASVKGINLFL